MLIPCHPIGTKRVCFSSHLHHCNIPNPPIFHLPFLIASKTIGTGMEETSKVSTLFELLGWELFKTRQNKVCLCGSRGTCASVCLPAQKLVCTICHWDSALNSTSTGCSHLWFWYMLRALFFPPKEFLIGFIALSSGNGRKGDGWIHLSLEIAFTAYNASEAWQASPRQSCG